MPPIPFIETAQLDPTEMRRVLRELVLAGSYAGTMKDLVGILGVDITPRAMAAWFMDNWVWLKGNGIVVRRKGRNSRGMVYLLEAI